MKSYVIYNADGDIIRAGVSDSDVAQNGEGEFEIECEWSTDLQNYKVIDGALVRKPQSEIDAMDFAVNMQKLRNDRDSMLTASDWTQTPDSPLSEAQQQSWRDYRQALRDLPENTTDPLNPTWPSKPS